MHESTRVEIELAVEKNPSIADSQVAEAIVHLKGHTLRARETARDMKAAIDELADKLVRQVKDIHDKRVGGRKHVKEPEIRPRRAPPRAASSPTWGFSGASARRATSSSSARRAVGRILSSAGRRRARDRRRPERPGGRGQADWDTSVGP